MKRIVIVLLIATLAITSITAQGMGRGMMGQGPAPVAQNQELVKVEGKLALVQGHPAVVVKEKTYYVQLPMFLYGFIDGLKEGATVKLEGYESPVPLAPNAYFLQAVKLTFGGKDYDLSQMMGGRHMMGNGMQAGQGRGGFGGRP